MNEGIIFDAASGPIMTGTWRNPKTGDKFTVRDTFFQDNQFMVQTTDGRLLDYNIIQDYIKLEKETEQDSNMMDNIFSKQNTNDIPDEVKNLIETDNKTEDPYSQYMIPEDAALSNNRGVNKQQGFTPQQNIPVSEDIIFIKRALSNTEIPVIGSEIKWTKYPQKKIEMLIDLLDVSPENIADWYIDKMNLNELRKNIRKSIINYIKGNDLGEPEKSKSEETPKEKHPLRSKRVSK